MRKKRRVIQKKANRIIYFSIEIERRFLATREPQWFRTQKWKKKLKVQNGRSTKVICRLCLIALVLLTQHSNWNGESQNKRFLFIFINTNTVRYTDKSKGTHIYGVTHEWNSFFRKATSKWIIIQIIVRSTLNIEKIFGYQTKPNNGMWKRMIYSNAIKCVVIFLSVFRE